MDAELTEAFKMYKWPLYLQGLHKAQRKRLFKRTFPIEMDYKYKSVLVRVHIFKLSTIFTCCKM
ncbi:unnamed protein product [Prunus armeniaca]|uniref:Uncharacterized protein n=1 Tax=Prunus armeniaca TaxID=36596 RepID=A0A6J5XRB0_PRUAR|nr:unnamed protein product [Prunus armeniaca]